MPRQSDARVQLVPTFGGSGEFKRRRLTDYTRLSLPFAAGIVAPHNDELVNQQMSHCECGSTVEMLTTLPLRAADRREL